jgi:F-type H+-transporting ATPase subunit b
MRGGWLCAALAALVVLADLGAGPVGAAEQKADIFNLRFDLGLWSIVVFLGLYFLLRRFAWGPILHGLQTREQAIRGAIEEAKLAREETAAARADFQRQLAEAHAEIPKLLEAARRDAQQLAEEMRAKAAQDIQAERQRLQREIETARGQALKDISDHAAQLATLISAKAIRRSLSPDDHRRLVDEALAELNDQARKKQ